ncbi:hypothetical protein APHAL10511_008079 [Amanita phalloides]|nr:hypothetical protein APHAL10511_008079 [Amanita phalloides]
MSTIPPFNISDVGETNQLCSYEERRIIKGSLRRKEDELENIRQQIDALSRHQNEIMEDIERHRIALAPYKILPEDIIRQIFTFYCHGTAHFPLLRSNPQLTLCAVCSAWRRVGLDMPHIWSDVVLYRASTSIRSRNLIAVMNEWLSRARHVPRSLAIELFGGEAVDKETLVQLIQSYQYRKIHLLLDYKVLSQALIELPDATFLHLEEIKIEVIAPVLHHDDGPFITPVLFKPTVRLTNTTSLEISGACDDRFLRTAFTSWLKLRHLDIAVYIPSQRCFEVLREGTSLDYCSLAVRRDSDFVTRSPTFDEPYLISNVQYLSLRFNSATTAEPYIRLLLLPRIRDLQLYTINSELTLGCDAIALAEMARRSQMKDIERLTYGNCDGPCDARMILECMPSLKFLSILGEAIFYGNQAMEDLAAGILGPHLTSFQADDMQGAGELAATVQIRNNNVQLTSINVHIRNLK